MEVLPDTRGRRRVKHLLLMYLFVLKAAADCSKPQESNNIVLTNEALLMNTFPEDVEVTLECANGYVQESGSRVITCISGNWTEPDLICKKKDCGPPQRQPHMTFDLSAGTLFGATIIAECDEGYDLSGSRHQQCLAPGWSGRATCEIVTCDSPAEVPNAKALWDPQEVPEYGQIIQYVCDEGYILVGTENITCTEDGVFDPEPPECKGVTTASTITNMVTPTPAAASPPAATSTAHRDKTFTTSATPTVSPSPPGVTTASTVTNMVTPTPAAASPPAATSTAHRDKTFTTSATPTVSPSPPGGRGILTAEERATPASVTSATPFQDKHDEIVESNKDVGYTAVIVSVICIVTVALVVFLGLYKFLLTRKGSYDTREDLKPELLQFQNL